MPRRKTSGKRRRSVRCKLCTSYRWMGNAKGRFKDKEEAIRQTTSEQKLFADYASCLEADLRMAEDSHYNSLFM